MKQTKFLTLISRHLPIVVVFLCVRVLCCIGAVVESGPPQRSGAARKELTLTEKQFAASTASVFKEYCIQCHGDKKTKGQLNLERIAAAPDFAMHFKSWEKVIAKLEAKEMPPEEKTQPSEPQRKKLVGDIRHALARHIEQTAGDPGRIAMRRLTSAEYAYTIQDLTGLELGLEHLFVNDAVGGEGFSNVGDVQFIEDSALERYLEAAKSVASHAVIGSGPLHFYRDPGKTGQELSAIRRIQEIYEEHGFRTASSEGGKPFGLERYPKAFYAAWQYQHRKELGLHDATLMKLANAEAIEPRFLEHIWSVLNDKALLYPSSEVAAAWRKLPTPNARNPKSETDMRAQCHSLYQLLAGWQSTFTENSSDDEVAAVLTENSFHPSMKQSLRAIVNWPKGATNAYLEISVIAAERERKAKPVIAWRQAGLRFRQLNRRRAPATPLKNVLSADAAQSLGLGRSPDGTAIGASDFVTTGAGVTRIQFTPPAGAPSAEFLVEAQLDTEHGDDCVVRCVISSEIGEGQTAAATGSVSALLANPSGKEIERVRAGVIELARKLPQISHREADPADKDPIPAPFDSALRSVERDEFHSQIKYNREDQFLVEHIIDDKTRVELDSAWADLLTAFEYHNTYFHLVAKKFKIDIGKRDIANLTPEWINSIPDEPRQYVKKLQEGYFHAQAAFKSAEPNHLDEVLKFAERAWRRPLVSLEKNRLKEFYSRLRTEGMQHDAALRSVIARVLVAPAFLYRMEGPQLNDATVAASLSLSQRATVNSDGTLPLPGRERGRAEGSLIPLSSMELANRLSYFLWSSIPDAELSRAATSGELLKPGQLTRQASRMLRDPKARRFATEFFGQWFGFYRFDGYRGLDTKRFTEFTDRLKSEMYDEAISFFEYIVRENRPVNEILFAEYSFLNRDLARHYGLDALEASTNVLMRVDGVNQFHRGGLLRLGAVLTATSAPLRTSAVKRGDWVLRRVLGTPVPPPPGDAGSIPPDDAMADGKTVRQRLEAHRRDASCVNCHSRIDALGFALEHFDSVGRWREKYRDGNTIDASGTLNDGTQINELDGLMNYLKSHHELFEKTLCAKLLGYALGRSELVSDRPLLQQMQVSLKKDNSIAGLVAQIVSSTQFRFQRAQSDVPIGGVKTAAR